FLALARQLRSSAALSRMSPSTSVGLRHASGLPDWFSHGRSSIPSWGFFTS
ncbi:hypothetical protein TNCT_100951, partial [Trichonephila clavata]